jgi:hypothetical protein
MLRSALITFGIFTAVAAFIFLVLLLGEGS